MESCYTLPLEDSRDRGPLPWFGGDNRERPAADAAAETFDNLKGALHDESREMLGVMPPQASPVLSQVFP